MPCNTRAFIGMETAVVFVRGVLPSIALLISTVAAGVVSARTMAPQYDALSSKKCTAWALLWFTVIVKIPMVAEMLDTRYVGGGC